MDLEQQQLQRTELEPISSQEAMNGATAEFQACIQERNCKEESAEGEEDVSRKTRSWNKMEELKQAENNILKILDIAGNITTNLSKIGDMDRDQSLGNAEEAIQLIKKVRGSLHKHAGSIRDYTPPGKDADCYRLRTEVSLLRQRAAYLELELADLQSK